MSTGITRINGVAFRNDLIHQNCTDTKTVEVDGIMYNENDVLTLVPKLITPGAIVAIGARRLLTTITPENDFINFVNVATGRTEYAQGIETQIAEDGTPFINLEDVDVDSVDTPMNNTPPVQL